ncbi:hypothetical protein ACX80D_07615 [Arthrobacter sp. Sr24]
MTVGCGAFDGGAWLALSPSLGVVAGRVAGRVVGEVVGEVAVALGADTVEVAAAEGVGDVVESLGGLLEQLPRMNAAPASNATNVILPLLRMAASVG